MCGDDRPTDQPIGCDCDANTLVLLFSLSLRSFDVSLVRSGQRAHTRCVRAASQARGDHSRKHVLRAECSLLCSVKTVQFISHTIKKKNEKKLINSICTHSFLSDNYLVARSSEVKFFPIASGHRFHLFVGFFLSHICFLCRSRDDDSLLCDFS